MNKSALNKVKIGSALLVLVIMAVFTHLINQPHLSNIEAAIKTSYADIEHISGTQLNGIDRDDLLVFDVREPDEYVVSHMSGAVHLSPDTDPQKFVEDYGDLFADKHLVFYCSVGHRSSEFLSQLGSAPQELGAKSSANLVGGVFDWVNNGRKLEDMTGELTDKVHPYNQVWGKLVNDQSKVAYTPRH